MSDLQLMQGVRDRVKATFVSLIPDDQWAIMIQKEVDSFFKTNANYHDSSRASPFMLLCRQVFEELTKEKLKEYMCGFTSDVWENNAPKLNEELKKVLIETAPEIFTSIFKNMFQHAINNTRTY